MSVTTTCNRLLQALSLDDLGRLLPHLERVNVHKGEVLIHQGQPLEFTYFPEGGLSSNLAVTSDGRKIEVGCFGFEGMVSTAAVLGSDRASHDILVQVGAPWLRVRTDVLVEATQASSTLQGVLLRYVQFQILTLSHSALANGAYRMRERLARWLLMAHDRLEGDDLALTHEFLSLMLGVQRSGVTLAIQEVEGLGLIRATRGHLKLLDRDGLLALAGDSYGFPEAEYERLIGPFRGEAPPHFS
ncbi:Crp/Fnr family transcriptional regulator [Methylobacterium flocculans]|uniref:Crp/Fnr family transcriptional regulator n=1 Tax=Methylobacterium flocculans TaxID=2984843 RepID=UPI0021F25ADB|nr:Crp/Fnr family transcriptional regulator [Methylobacterium sp. FF17]